MNPLSRDAVERFVDEGAVRLEGAFSRELADRCRELLWPATGCDPRDRSTWTKPVVRLGDRMDPPFVEACNTARLHGAFDQLVGPGRWLPRGSVGTFVVRFPHADPPGDDGWHVDASFPPIEGEEDPGGYFGWRVDARSRGRALLLLFLFSDTGEDEAPTRIRLGSHRDVARILQPEGERGLGFFPLAQRLDATASRPQATATGEAGTVWLCHPLLVHAAQAIRGDRPRFLAQPPLLPVGAFDPQGESPVERGLR